MFTKLIATLLAIMTLIGSSPAIEIVDSENLTIEDLQNRNGKLIIERVVGVVVDDDGNGYPIYDSNYYICYKSVEGASKGDVICTYLVYNPFNNYEDDIIFRFDYIMSSQSEV